MVRATEPATPESDPDMITIDCPICEGTATVDDDLARLDCDACGAATEIAPDPQPRSLQAAA